MNLRSSGRADLEISAPIWVRDRLEALSYVISVNQRSPAVLAPVVFLPA
jgi:hypothetical protein